MFKILLYFWGFIVAAVFVNARPQHDYNLCKKYPELPYCKIENLEFHISRVISAEPEPDPNILSKKLIDPVNSSVPADPILSNSERELAIKDSKKPIEELVKDHRAKKSRDKREIKDSDSENTEEDEYLRYRKERAKILNELNDLDDGQRYRTFSSSSSAGRRYYPSSSVAAYPSYGQSLYGYPSYGYGSGGGGANTFGIGSGLNVMGVGVSSGLGLNIG